MPASPHADRPDEGHHAPRPSPADADTERVKLHSAEFAADPHRSYRAMRERYGSLVPVELAQGVPATLAVGYRTGLQILHDPDHFPADPRAWEKTVASDCPVLPILQWRPNALRSTGIEHQRYRGANTAAINGVDLHGLHATVEQIAMGLIEGFRGRESADLVADYALPLAFAAINTMLGCPPEIGQRIAVATAGVFDGVDAENSNLQLAEAVLELVELKRREPGDDITSRLLAHSSALDETELIHQIVVLYGAGIEPLQNLIANTLVLILTSDQLAGHVLGGSLSTRDALDEVLFNDPPMANFSITYPRQPVLLEDMWLPAHQPVVVSLAGCNNDPHINNGDHTGNRAHLAWGAGPHACPARQPAYLIAQDAIDQLLDAIPELSLAVPRSELRWRPGPFHRALTTLPVRYPPDTTPVDPQSLP